MVVWLLIKTLKLMGEWLHNRRNTKRKNIHSKQWINTNTRKYKTNKRETNGL